MSALERWLLRLWYGHQPWAVALLAPLSGVFCWMAVARRWWQQRQQVHHPVPVIVVGNISVGGTGKTPLVIWLVEVLREAGYRPGVVSRGFGGSTTEASYVAATDAPVQVGDEPLLVVQRTGVPLVVGSDRNQAVRLLLQAPGQCNIVIADDGLQHYRLGRDVEIAVVDGQRRFGNGWCLPAGPLRERAARLQECDFVVVNGEELKLAGDELIRLQGGASRALQQLAGQTVHAVTGIGNPQRFLAMLEKAGLRVIAHLYPDHHAFSGDEFRFNDGFPILMTEKDAVKCRDCDLPDAWYLPVRAVLPDGFAHALLKRLATVNQGMPHGQETAGNSRLPRHQGSVKL